MLSPMVRVLPVLLTLLLAACAGTPPQAVDTPGGGRYYLAATPADRHYIRSYGYGDPVFYWWGLNPWWNYGYYTYYSPYLYPYRFVVHYGWHGYGGFGYPGYPWPYHWRPHHPPHVAAPVDNSVAPVPPVAALPPVTPPALDPERARRWEDRMLRRETPPGSLPSQRPGFPAPSPASVAPVRHSTPAYRTVAPRSIPQSAPRAVSAPPSRAISTGSPRTRTLHDQ